MDRAILKCNNGTEQVALLSKIMVCVSAESKLQKCSVRNYPSHIGYGC